MKKAILCVTFLVIAAASFSQQPDPSQPLTREDYLQKSKNQKIAAWALLGGGLAMFAIAAPGEVSFNTLGTLVILGAAGTLGSIPLFIAAARNKRKAMKATASLKFESSPSIYPESMGFHSMPSLSIKINL